MKKKIIALTLAALMCASLTACDFVPNSNSVSVSEGQSAQIPDLTGQWKQVNSKSDDSWQAAVIEGDVMEIYWVSDNGDTKSLYWAGSFVAPTTADEPYTFDSVNDKSKTDNALMASGDDTKTFTYENGQLSYEASALGTTSTIRLEKQ